MANNIIQQILRQIEKSAYWLVDEQNILITGTGRSGTTWVAELLNFKNDYQILFEPFRNDKTPEWKKFNHSQYVHPTNKFEGEEIVDDVFDNKIHNEWIDSRKNSNPNAEK